ncbi:hypothetical protein HK101_010129 [Irineochytrium annulatum]|nr:hypothetical protein HK101_010129 [Irineochytrium annulatum]
MNGNWYPKWHGRPLQYKAFWLRIYEAVNAAGAKVDFLWSPNAADGYPFGGGPVSAPDGLFPNATEYHELDTNGDGVVDSHDDPFAPYYPGDDVVDWVGLSVYWKGYQGEESSLNVPAPGSFFSDMITGSNPRVAGTTHGPEVYNFYATYAAGKGKPFAAGETGAAFDVNSDSAIGQTSFQRAYWGSFLTNQAFLDTFPLLKCVNIFDDNLVRDFRLTYDPLVRAQFLADLAPVENRILWAQPLAVAVGSVSPNWTVQDGEERKIERPEPVTTQVFSVKSLAGERVGRLWMGRAVAVAGLVSTLFGLL